MPDRANARQGLLNRVGWGDATAVFLAGDASDRTYDRLTLAGKSAVLMDAPPGKGDDPATFVAVAAHLNAVGLSAPQLIGQDLTHGFLVLEDFGDAVFANVLRRQPAQEAQLYAAATDAVIQLQAAPPMPGLPTLAPTDWAEAAALVLQHYRAAACPDPCDVASFTAQLGTLIASVAPERPVMILRDFHAENLIWLPDRRGPAQAGLLDFQLAQMGHPVYDIVSLLQDARRDVGAQTATQVGQRFCQASGMTEAEFAQAAAVWGTQRALRILGVFARLAQTAGKTTYLALMPRVWGHLQASLRHPSLDVFAQMLAQILPPPTPDVQRKIAQHAVR
jgi:N-acetylmuramate 1-kinase